MPKLNVTLPHKLSQDEALYRVQSLLRDVKTQFAERISDLRETWNGNQGDFSFSVDAEVVTVSVTGKLTVKDSQVELTGEIPWKALPFKGKIESKIREQATKILST